MTVHRRLFVCLMGIALLGVLAAPVFGQPARTAQSAMITYEGPTSFVVLEECAYNSPGTTCEAPYFTCTATTEYFVGVTSCAGTATFSTVAAASPSPSLINANKCNFFNGTPLTGSTDVGSCTPTRCTTPSGPCDLSGSPNSRKRTTTVCVDSGTSRTGFTSCSGAAPTCWNQTSNTSGSTPITPAGKVAGESALCNNRNPLKYSFTIQDPTNPLCIGGVGNCTRVTGLTATLTNNADSSTVATWSEGLGNMTVGLEFTGQDFPYKGSNGANGFVGLLTSSNGASDAGPDYNPGCTSEPAASTTCGSYTGPGACVNAIQGGSVSACGLLPNPCTQFTDNFPGNNGIGGDRVAYTGTASSTVPAGSYTMTITGLIKGSVNGLADLSILGTACINVSAGSCNVSTCP